MEASTSNRLLSPVRSRAFWLTVLLLALIAIPHYAEALQPDFVSELTSRLGLDRHALERILLLVPIFVAGIGLGARGALLVSVAALALMLPRAIVVSEHQADALLETSAVFAIGILLTHSFRLLHTQREIADRLRASEERYHHLFENAHDSIWQHDLEGNIVAANKSFLDLTGYGADDLPNIKAYDLISECSTDGIDRTQDPIVKAEIAGGLSEAMLVRKDGSSAHIHLSTDAIMDNGRIVGFQHVARDVTKERQMRDNLRYYLQQVTKAQEEERKRIARELHDDTVQSMVVLARQLDDLATRTDELSPQQREFVEGLWQQTHSIMEGLRRLSQDLRPPALDRLGLLPALESLAANVQNHSGITIEVKANRMERRTSPEVELVLFRIVQEALSNVRKHSEATQAHVTLDFGSDMTRVTVADNGKGFAIPSLTGNFAKEGKLGLAGMEERARLIGGNLQIQSEPGRGTTVTIEVAK